MDDPYVLLARALGHLSAQEQGEVLKSLLPPPLPGAAPTGWLAQSAATRAAFALQLEDEVARPAAERVGLLVRLPASTHRRLKSWSDAHGHSMNVVVRGLVEQFLDAQDAGTRRPTG